MSTDPSGRTALAPVEAEYWNIKDIQFHCRIGRSTAWRLVREEGFPPPVVCGQRCVLWPRAEVVAYLEARRDPEHYRTPVTAKLAHEAQYSMRPARRRSA